jgi:hypothetical protein
MGMDRTYQVRDVDGLEQDRACRSVQVQQCCGFVGLQEEARVGPLDAPKRRQGAADALELAGGRKELGWWTVRTCYEGREGEDAGEETRVVRWSSHRLRSRLSRSCPVVVVAGRWTRCQSETTTDGEIDEMRLNCKNETLSEGAHRNGRIQ